MDLKRIVDQPLALAIEWFQRIVRRPFSNQLSKTAVWIGALIVAAPPLEHLLISTLLERVLGIDIGIEAPDRYAYIAGTTVIALGLLNHLAYIFLNLKHENEQGEARVSEYRELWKRIHKMTDSTLRLSNLYYGTYRDSDQVYLSKAQEDTTEVQTYVGLNKPFLPSQEIVSRSLALARDCRSEVEAFLGVIDMKKNPSSNYSLARALKDASDAGGRIEVDYEELKALISDEVGRLKTR
ncbi:MULTISPECIES: hypothetical protein [unclassified Stenotrophomonas]|uniref:hypothetical protein n=1 Tax=unclassified Stenotrophomonas TaxID=196198 RepID=UPI00346563FD